MSETRAAQALAAVLERLPAADEGNGDYRVLDSWTEGDDTICLVYRGWWHDGTLGLQRRIDPDLPLDIVVGQILDAELGEPPGLVVEAVAPGFQRVYVVARRATRVVARTWRPRGVTGGRNTRVRRRPRVLRLCREPRWALVRC